MRLIDADALEEHKFTSSEANHNDMGGAYRTGWNDAIDAIYDNAPTVDAVDVVKQMFDGEMKLMPLEVDAVRRGRWLFPFGDRRYKKCSECGRTFYSIPYDSNYCPNCGARMDGVE